MTAENHEDHQPGVTEADAWAKCPDKNSCRAIGRARTPCLACWDAAGDVVAGLHLDDLKRHERPLETDYSNLQVSAGWTYVTWASRWERGRKAIYVIDGDFLASYKHVFLSGTFTSFEAAEKALCERRSS